MRMFWIPFVLLCLTACAPPPPVSTASGTTFVALGDAPYGPPAEVFPPYAALIANINAADPALVIHVGDTLGGTSCDDASLDRIRGMINDVKAPVLYTPGDNEWTDCGSESAGRFDPLDRLAYLRRTWFADNTTLGAQRKPVTRQRKAGYPENARLMQDNIGFITAHVVGSNNNFNPSDPKAADEFYARNRANVAWLTDSFAAFKDADAIVVALHADMFRPLSGFDKGWHAMSPFRDIGVLLGEQSSALQKPVLLLYGDSHVHKSFQPFKQHRPYLHAMQVYGYPDIKAISIAVRPDAKRPFTVTHVFTP